MVVVWVVLVVGYAMWSTSQSQLECHPRVVLVWVLVVVGWG